MPRVAEDQNFPEFFGPNKMEALKESHPFCFIVGSRAKSPSKSMFHVLQDPLESHQRLPPLDYISKPHQRIRSRNFCP